jgi:hypothetical protein
VKRTRRWALLWVLIGLVGLVTGACFNVLEAPGVGAKAEQGYQACAPLIEALAQYHLQKNEYPAALAELVPAVLAALPPEVKSMEITYAREGASYTLKFSYTGPGINHCSYTPADGWKCSGYY